MSLILGNRYSVDINFSGEKRYFKYTPEYDGEFSIESFSIVSGDPYVWVYDSNYILLDSDDDTGDVPNFKLSYYLYSGETYYFAVGCFGTGTGSYQLTLKSTLPAGYTRYTPTDGVYFIMNAHSWRSVYPYNNSDGATVRQYDLYYNNRIPISRKWEIKKQSDGYYSIRNLTSGKYIGVDFSQSLDTNPSVRQYSSSSGNNVRWAMYTTPSDTIILVPKDSRCEPCVYTMSVNIGYNQNNTPLSLFLRSDVTNQQNEWKLIPSDFGDQYVSKIQNDQNEQYVYTSNDSVGSQVKSAISITTQNFLWRFEYYGVLAETNEPYYYIKNVATGLYLTAPQNTTNNAPITQADFYPNAQKQLWRLLLQEDGTYTIENRYQYNYNSMPYKLALDNGNLVQTSSVSNIKWNITTQVYTITLVNYYDQGFLERDPNASDTISEINHRVSEICWLNFGLSVNFAIQSYTSCADNCTAGINELCKHCDQIPQCNNLPCEHSHTSRNNIEKDLRAQYGAGNTLLTRVAFCGSIVNNNQTSAAYSSNIVILTTSGRINANNELEPDYIERYISSMTHEIAHRMSAPDHYCNGKYDTASKKYIGCKTKDCWRCKNAYSTAPQCIMSENGYVFFRGKYDYGLLDELFCEQCKSQTHETFGVGYHLTNHHANKNPHD